MFSFEFRWYNCNVCPVNCSNYTWKSAFIEKSQCYYVLSVVNVVQRQLLTDDCDIHVNISWPTRRWYKLDTKKLKVFII